MYSFVNAPLLVRDLARHHRADALALELLHALALDGRTLRALERRGHDGTAHARRQALIRQQRQQPPALQVLAAARAAAADLGLRAYSAAADVLERTPIGSLDGLVRFVETEVLEAAWTRSDDLSVLDCPRAMQTVLDGIVGVYCDDEVIARAWTSYAVGLDVPTTPWPEIVEAVARVSPDAVWPAPPAEWAAQVHEACWAVHLTGRGRAATVTQLHALRALRSVSQPRPLRAVATVVAAVHAHVVADVLDADTHLKMTAPLFSLLP